MLFLVGWPHIWTKDDEGASTKQGYQSLREQSSYISQTCCPRVISKRTSKHTRLCEYAALYFGHKLHIDQNEKLKMYGVTHVVARDGFSGKIVSFVTMPIKSNTVIYEAIYR